MTPDPWDRQVNSDGDSLADAAVATAEFIANDQLGRVIAYLDLIAECLAGLPDINDMGRRRRRLAEIRSGENGTPTR